MPAMTRENGVRVIARSLVEDCVDPHDAGAIL